MARDPDEARATEMVRCPTCRASQEWSDACRRCKSDLRLLRAFATAYERYRRDCLEHLRSGDPVAARGAARRCHELRPGDESRRLLAVASLRCGDWWTAADLSGRGLSEGS